MSTSSVPVFATFFGRVPEIFGALPIRVLLMDKENGFHSILVEILRLISTGLISWLFNTTNKKRIPITADSIAWFDNNNCPIKSNHNLANQNWNNMVGRRRPAAAAGGSGLILGDRHAQGTC
jgi:hypothetical protein